MMITNGQTVRILDRSLATCRENLAKYERLIEAVKKQIFELEPMRDHLASLPDTNLLSGNTPPTADPDFAKCGHPPDCLSEGPRIPLRYGSAATEVCSACGGYRQIRSPDRWEPGPPDTTEDEEL